MEVYPNGSEGSFNSEEADGIVKEILLHAESEARFIGNGNHTNTTDNIRQWTCIEGVVGGDDYNQSQVNKWTAGIVERCLTQFVKQGKPYKYIVTCAVLQKTGAGLHTANSCYWDTALDGSCTVRWENRTMYCVVSVFAVAIA